MGTDLTDQLIYSQRDTLNRIVRKHLEFKGHADTPVNVIAVLDSIGLIDRGAARLAVMKERFNELNEENRRLRDQLFASQQPIKPRED